MKTLLLSCTGSSRNFFQFSTEFLLRHNQNLEGAETNGNSRKIQQSDVINVQCEICSYDRFCKTKELEGENKSVL